MKLMRTPLCGLLISFALSNAFAQDEDLFNKHTIRPSDIPSNAPQQKDFPASPIFDGTPAVPRIQSHRSKNFRTVITQGAKEPPNFAGHYTIIYWGCGTGCVELAIVDAISGAVYHPPNLASIQNNNVDFEGMEKRGQALRQHEVGSRLLTVVGEINEESKLRGISYFEWKDNTLHRIRFVPKPEELIPPPSAHK